MKRRVYKKTEQYKTTRDDVRQRIMELKKYYQKQTQEFKNKTVEEIVNAKVEPDKTFWPDIQGD